LSGDLPYDEIVTFVRGGGFIAYFPMVNRRWRVVIAYEMDKAPTGDVTLEEIQHMIDICGPVGARASEPTDLGRFHVNQHKAERQQVGEALLRGTGRATRLVLTRNPLLVALRNALAPLFFPSLPGALHRLAEAITEISIAYHHSPIVRDGRDKKGALQAGDRAPNGLVQTSEKAAPGLEQAARHILYDCTGELHQRYEAEQGGLVLIRPDGYIGFWCQFGATEPLRGYVNALFVSGGGAQP
jgi:hypothetical protein